MRIKSICVSMLIMISNGNQIIVADVATITREDGRPHTLVQAFS